MSSVYDGRRAVLATKHDKLALIGPVLTERIGLGVQAVAVDTDVLGTFSGEVPRPGPPWDTAVAKARMGLAASGHHLGLASEGTIGSATPLGLGVVATELVVFVDDERGIVVGETAVGHDLVVASTTVTVGDELDGILAQAEVPPHRLIVAPADGPRGPVVKAVGADELARAVATCAEASVGGRVRIETDLRAHVCPSRRPLIARAATALADRLARACPSCGTPGWGQTGLELGVPCAWCGAAVGIPRARRDGCVACPSERLVSVGPERADPGLCPDCNP